MKKILIALMIMFSSVFANDFMINAKVLKNNILVWKPIMLVKQNIPNKTAPYEARFDYLTVIANKLNDDDIKLDIDFVLNNKKIKKSVVAKYDKQLIIKDDDISIQLKVTRFSQQTKTPKELNLDDEIMQAFKEHKADIKGAVPFHIARVSFLGFSRDGRFFAYTTCSHSSVTEGVGVGFVIQNLATDKFVFEDYIQTGEHNDRRMDFEKYWYLKNKIITKQLELYDIKIDENLTLKSFSIKYKDDTITVKTKDIKTKNEDFIGFLDESYLYMNSSKNGEKLINKQNYGSYKNTIKTSSLGYFDSKKDRIAVVYADLVNGFEGAPHYVIYSIVGASLKYGFKQTK
jgi:hypothetical protein